MLALRQYMRPQRRPLLRECGYPQAQGMWPQCLGWRIPQPVMSLAPPLAPPHCIQDMQECGKSHSLSCHPSGWQIPQPSSRDAHAHSPIATGTCLNDLYRFSVATGRWTELFPGGEPPDVRQLFGFAATVDGMLYVFGGDDTSNMS